MAERPGPREAPDRDVLADVVPLFGRRRPPESVPEEAEPAAPDLPVAHRVRAVDGRTLFAIWAVVAACGLPLAALLTVLGAAALLPEALLSAAWTVLPVVGLGAAGVVAWAHSVGEDRFVLDDEGLRVERTVRGPPRTDRVPWEEVESFRRTPEHLVVRRAAADTLTIPRGRTPAARDGFRDLVRAFAAGAQARGVPELHASPDTSSADRDADADPALPATARRHAWTATVPALLVVLLAAGQVRDTGWTDPVSLLLLAVGAGLVGLAAAAWIEALRDGR